MSHEPFAFKGLPTKAITKTQPQFHVLNSNKLNHQQKSMTQSLPSRSNHDEISKSNTAPNQQEQYFMIRTPENVPKITLIKNHEYFSDFTEMETKV